MARLSLLAVCILFIVSLLIVGSEGREQVDARLGETFSQDLGLLARMDAWKNSVQMIRDFPVFGVGLAAWPEVFSRYQPGPWSADYFHEAHNDYVELLADTGIIGFGLLAWFFIRGGKRLVQGIKKAPSKNLPLVAAILAALGVMAFHELLDFSLQIPANAFLFTLLFALGLRLARQARDRRSEVGDQLATIGHQPFAMGHMHSAITPEWSEVKDGPPIRNPQFAIRNFATRHSPFAISALAVILVVCAVTQEQSVKLKRPESLAEAKERIFSRPSKASYHMAMLRVMKDKAPLSWQLSEYKAALWIEPTNPYTRDRYASTLLSMGRTDEALCEITRSVTESPSLKLHEYLGAEALPRLSEEERSAVAEGFRQALARDYPETLKNFAEFYARLSRFADQGALYEQAAVKETDGAKKAELLISGGLAYLQGAVRGEGLGVRRDDGSKEVRAGSGDPEVPSTLLRTGSGQTSEVRERGNAKDAERNNANNATNAKNAERLFRSAIAANPTDARAYQQLVTTIFGARQDLDGAKDVVSSGIKNGAPPLPLYLSLAEAAQKSGSPDETKAALESAKAEVEKLVKNGQNPYTLYILLAEGARRAGDRDQESAALLKALDLQPHSAGTLSRLASLYFEKQNFDRAALYLNRVAKINPDAANVYYSLALAEEGRYRFADAGRAYARAVELAPKNDNYRKRYDAFRERVAANAPERDRKVANSKSP
jgi:tetratricopeptide (TPR) repeat protein